VRVYDHKMDRQARTSLDIGELFRRVVHHCVDRGVADITRSGISVTSEREGMGLVDFSWVCSSCFLFSFPAIRPSFCSRNALAALDG